MRKFLIGNAMAMALGASAFAGQPPPSNPPPKTQVTLNPAVNFNNGVQMNTDIAVGPVALANSTAVKLNANVGASLSATAGGWVP
jgi:hypothetical protein